MLPHLSGQWLWAMHLASQGCSPQQGMQQVLQRMSTGEKLKTTGLFKDSKDREKQRLRLKINSMARATRASEEP